MIDDEDESFLVPAETNNPPKEKVWCKIGEKGNLEYVDWGMIKDIADQFDVAPIDARTEHMVIAKLMWLVRQETLKEIRNGND